MKVSEKLIAAKTLIDSPEKWIQNINAGIRGTNGFVMQTHSQDKHANCFCSVGAPSRIDPYTTDIHDYLCKAMNGLEGWVSEFNDSHNHTEVMTMWDKAIALAKEDEGAT